MLAPERRAQVLEIAVAAGAFIVEDEAFRDLTLEGPEPPPPLLHGDADGHVVHLRSLSKPAAPGLRVSCLVARGPAAARLRAARMVDGTLVPGPLQEAAVELVTAPGWRRHLTRTRAVLRERRDALLAAVEAELGPGRAPARAAACTSGCGSTRASTTSRSPSAPPAPACWSRPAVRTSRPSRPAAICGSRSRASRRTAWRPAFASSPASE